MLFQEYQTPQANVVQPELYRSIVPMIILPLQIGDVYRAGMGDVYLGIRDVYFTNGSVIVNYVVQVAANAPSNVTAILTLLLSNGTYGNLTVTGTSFTGKCMA